MLFYLEVMGGMRAHQTVIGHTMYANPSGGCGGTAAGRSSFHALYAMRASRLPPQRPPERLTQPTMPRPVGPGGASLR